MERVAMAYSGGLYASICVHWLRHEQGLNVITFSADLEQGRDLEQVAERAIGMGAKAAHIADLKDRFVADFVAPALRAHARYESGYLLATALTRPLIAKELVKIAREEGCRYVAHGGRGRGNDQVRFETAVASVAPQLEVIDPCTVCDLGSQQEEVEYAQMHEIPIPEAEISPYNIDRNLWGASIEYGALDDPWVAPPEDVYQMTTAPEQAPDEPTQVEIGFERGVPVSLDGEERPLRQIIERLNDLAGRNGVGRVDQVENKLVGVKSREVYEAPAATVLYAAHASLEDLVLSADVLHYRQTVAERYSELVYRGRWYSELREALDSFFLQTQRYLTGLVRVRLYKGSCVVEGRKSPHSLYDPRMASQSASGLFGRSATRAFIDISSLSVKAEGAKRRERSQVD